MVGEVKTGKTERTLSILRDLIQCGEGSLSVLDLAPEKVRGVGGRLVLTPEEKKSLLYLSPLIVPPRLLGKNEMEIQNLACQNEKRIQEALGVLRLRECHTLVVNDVSLYFQAGTASHFISSLEGIATWVMNGYYGCFFGESDLSRREREQMEILMSFCDSVVHLPFKTPKLP